MGGCVYVRTTALVGSMGLSGWVGGGGQQHVGVVVCMCAIHLSSIIYFPTSHQRPCMPLTHQHQPQAFSSKPLALCLLASTALGLLLFLHKWLQATQPPPPPKKGAKASPAASPAARAAALLAQFIPRKIAGGKRPQQQKKQGQGEEEEEGPCLAPRYVALAMLTCNFVGVVFARTLHYQVGRWVGERREKRGGDVMGCDGGSIDT